MAGEVDKPKPVIVALMMRCPICDKWWVFEYRAQVSKYSDVEGVFAGTHQGKPCWRVKTEKFGPGVLCGEHHAKRKALVTKKGASVRPWEDEDERRLWGRIRNQEEFAALVAITPDTGNELRDDQRLDSTAILGRGITITKERCLMLGLDKWTKGLE